MDRFDQQFQNIRKEKKKQTFVSKKFPRVVYQKNPRTYHFILSPYCTVWGLTLIFFKFLKSRVKDSNFYFIKLFFSNESKFSFTMIELIEEFFSAKFEFCEFKVGIIFLCFFLSVRIATCFFDKNDEYK